MEAHARGHPTDHQARQPVHMTVATGTAVYSYNMSVNNLDEKQVKKLFLWLVEAPAGAGRMNSFGNHI